MRSPLSGKIVDEAVPYTRDIVVLRGNSLGVRIEHACC